MNMDLEYGMYNEERLTEKTDFSKNPRAVYTVAMNIRKLPIGIQSFEDLRRSGYLYVDKTEHIWNLVQTGKTYFLSRPRRFGKSLLLSTMKAYFEGKKELFAGLKLAELEQDWTAYPIFYFDFNGANYKDSSSLPDVINQHLEKWEELYGDEKKERSLAERFKYLIEAAQKKTGLQVVVLVDEYDKSLLESESETLEKNRALFKGFFGNLKSSDEHLKFVFITGVTKFSKVSIFSDLNQLHDISLSRDYASICGISQTEMEVHFKPEIEASAKENGLSYAECLEKLRQMYDGYHFYQDTVGMYNPFSLINALYEKDFKSYWFETGTPTFLIEKLKAANYNPQNFTDGVSADARSLSDYRIDNPDPVPLFYQTGYLTIKGYDRDFGLYTLSYPNDEVQYAFLNSLVPDYIGLLASETGLCVKNFILDLRSGKIDDVLTRFKSLFARLPYSTRTDDTVIEQNFQNVIYIVFMLLGQFVGVEEHYSQGRADCVVQTKDFVYLFEFKRDKSAAEALAQIEEKNYAAPFAADSRTILKVGVSFSSEEKNIVEWRVENSRANGTSVFN